MSRNAVRNSTERFGSEYDLESRRFVFFCTSSVAGANTVLLSTYKWDNMLVLKEVVFDCMIP